MPNLQEPSHVSRRNILINSLGMGVATIALLAATAVGSKEGDPKGSTSKSADGQKAKSNLTGTACEKAGGSNCQGRTRPRRPDKTEDKKM